ncbi:MAG: beta strand repeat-containing protein, partial [Gemmatimonadaceae bacterium]
TTGLTVVFTKGPGTSDGNLSSVTDNGNGTYAATFTGTTAGTARTISATIGGAPLTSVAPTITVTPGPASANSTLTVGAATLNVGNATILTLSARDAAGNTLTSGGAAVVFTKGSGTSDGTISAVTDNNNGTYTATFTATTIGTARTISATVGGVAITTAPPTITVQQGSVSLSQSLVTVGSSALVAGEQTTLTLTARDAGGNPLPSGGLTVVFTKGSGSSDGTIGAVTDNNNGTYTATFTATTAGTARSIGATIGGAAVTSAAPSITVTAATASTAQSLVSVGSAQLASGASTTVTMTARTAAGGPITVGGLTVTFVKGTGSSDGTFSAVTDNNNGTYIASFTATTAGTARSISATIGGTPLTSVSPSITVTPGPASVNSTLTVGAATVSVGNTTTLTLTARDAAGNQLTSGGAAVVFTKGSGTSDGTISPVTDNNNGTYSATFTATTVGTARTISATVGGVAITTALPTITVQPGSVSFAQSLVTVGTSSLAAGMQTTLTLTARDAGGNPLASGGLVVVFTKGSGTSDGTIGAVTDNNNGTYTATFTATTAGTARPIGATIGGAPVTSAAPTITVAPGATSLAQSTLTVGAGSVVSGANTTLTLTTRDAAGNARTVGGETVLFTKGVGTSDGTISAVTDNNNGTYTATFTATTAGTARSISATVGGNAVTSVSPTITVTAGAVSLAQSTVVIGTASIASGATSTLTLITRDAAGNARTTSAGTVLFTKGVGTSDGTISSVTNNNNGTYSATFTGTVSGTPRAIGATIAGAALTSPAPTITVTPGAASSASIVGVSAATVANGASITLTLNARDLAGNVVTTGGATVLFTKGSGTSDGTISATTDNGNGTYTATFTATVAGTARQIGATVNGAAVTTALPSVLVLPPPTIALGTDTVLINVQVNTTSAIQFVTVANIGSGSVSGLSSSNVSIPGGPTQCGSVNWLVTPTFDMGGTAAPLSLMSVQVNATGLALGTCARTVTVSSTTPGVASRQFVVVANVGRSAVAEGALRVVMMGDAGNNTVQIITPTPILTIDNGGRGTISGVTATVVSTTGFAECTDPFDETTCVPWLTNADLVLSSTTLPTTLSIISQVRPFSASAVIRVQGNGMPTRDFPVDVFFNIEPALVTNARNVMLKGRVGGANVADTVVALNQNVANPGLTNYRRDLAGPALPSWLTVTFQPSGNNANVIFSANLASFSRDTVVSDSVRVIADCTIVGDCFSGTVKGYYVPYSLIVERGLVTSLANASLFAAVGGTSVAQDVAVSNSGAGELTGLTATIGAGATWLTAAFVGGTTTPATLRLTANPAGRAAGEYNTTVTVRTGAGATLQTRIIPVRFVVY